MPYDRMLMRCQWQQFSNGICKALFNPVVDGVAQPEAVLFNGDRERGPYVEGKFYWITIEPAAPR